MKNHYVLDTELCRVVAAFKHRRVADRYAACHLEHGAAFRADNPAEFRDAFNDDVKARVLLAHGAHTCEHLLTLLAEDATLPTPGHYGARDALHDLLSRPGAAYSLPELITLVGAPRPTIVCGLTALKRGHGDLPPLHTQRKDNVYRVRSESTP